ncbi:MAG: hypothetical protein FVQ85_21790 [Planctomycetes bacterium]|nr:hypothetical protein [Planctomycetota bacterium]
MIVYPHLFLFGSGLSVPAGLPSMSAITERVFSGTGICRHANGNYYLSPPFNTPADPTRDYLPAILEYISLVGNEIAAFYRGFREYSRNYEDLYYLFSQIRDSEYGEYENPIVQPFIDKLLPGLEPYLNPTRPGARRFSIGELTRETCNYIEDVVWNLLDTSIEDLGYLEFLFTCAKDPDIQNFDIFTLNHDTILEQYLSSMGLRIIDGFSEPVNNVRYLDLRLFDNPVNSIRLFKLHGSINWFRFTSRSSTLAYDDIGIPLEADYWHTRNPNGVMQLPVDGRPMFLVGVFNKILHYTSGLYADMHYYFHASLKNISRLVVCGYGWRDKGINSRIINWLYSNDENLVVLIHPRPDSCMQNARGAISNKWDSWLKSNRMKIVTAGAEDISWDIIKGHITC